ncbi:FKBP-type peptidyl-prolyl cis-trans isomerase [Brevundimonas goettingensis]|uniref:FKBP-type peptidyl-prolyl cis-trans isomerase n=1 Tax=Brevundimonas goettingensis TaxID=2774190 RepID=UPI0021F23869|nr:FKBP-type peptidyl-prolyl cis-trans isomerase [Brevundimonas goettingensis]
MDKNKSAPGIQTLPSGLQYKVLVSGPSGAAGPDRNDLVRVDYEGALVDGTVFDSSFERGVPLAIHVDEVVPGWTEALQRMKAGDEWMLYVPPELGYKDQRAGDIPPIRCWSSASSFWTWPRSPAPAAPSGQRTADPRGLSPHRAQRGEVARRFFSDVTEGSGFLASARLSAGPAKNPLHPGASGPRSPSPR